MYCHSLLNLPPKKVSLIYNSNLNFPLPILTLVYLAPSLELPSVAIT